jgi:hypothetical protein
LLNKTSFTFNPLGLKVVGDWITKRDVDGHEAMKISSRQKEPG